MRLRPLLLAIALPLFGCWEMPPSSVPLSTAGEDVEILSETPSPEIYESFQELSMQALGSNGREATVTARHMLRNRGAELGARFVSVDDASATLAWDFSGRTIVTLRGRAFRVKEDGPSSRAFEPEPRAFPSALPRAGDTVADAGAPDATMMGASGGPAPSGSSKGPKAPPPKAAPSGAPKLQAAPSGAPKPPTAPPKPAASAR